MTLRKNHDFNLLSHKILQIANREMPQHDFMRKIVSMLSEFSGCEAVQIWLKEENHSQRFEVARLTTDQFSYHINMPYTYRQENDEVRGENQLYLIRQFILSRTTNVLNENMLSEHGSFFLVRKNKELFVLTNDTPLKVEIDILGTNINSIALIPLTAGDTVIGLFQFVSERPGIFTRDEIEHYEHTAQILSIALINQRAQSSLRERVKELTCLYDLARLAEKPGATLDDILQDIADLLPAAWQYPEITSGRILLDDSQFATSGFPEGGQKQSSDIIVNNVRRGAVEVIYGEERQELDEGPFLREERNLIDAIAREVAHIIERREAQQAKIKLEDQLRHADRLATIGQLAAGVAHELNEPLGNILGFAQLIQKNPELSDQTNKDTEKIVAASLYAREVIRKLMLFARQTPPSKSSVNLNKIIQDGLYFLEARCQKSGIELIRKLDGQLPEIIADSSQFHQVLVNLVVNAVQAMPEGGRLVVASSHTHEKVILEVQDEGTGMDRKTLKQIFIPFFTTKDVDQGTGLGLAVVHGIVSAHGGKIDVESKPGKGSIFRVILPVLQSLEKKE